MTDFVTNILTCYGMATRQEKLDGLQWYNRARRDCRKVAKTKNLSLMKVVGVVAASSPNLGWPKNVPTAEQIIDGHMAQINHEDIDGCMAYKANRLKGYKVLDGVNRYAAILKTLNGPKISAFFDNIMGGDSVTVDGHARNIAYGERVGLKSNAANIGKAEYLNIAMSYRHAAAILGIKACDLQAITWVTWRRVHGIK
jgi:hypothetical protein